MANNGRGIGSIDQESRTVWGHSLRAVAVCTGAGAAIALIALFGPLG